MVLPQVIVDVGFGSPTVGDVFVVGDPVRGRVGFVPIGGDGLWTNLSPWVRSWSVRRGASRGDAPQVRYEPGTATIVLHDPDRRFDPENLAGPYVAAGRSQVEPMRMVRIRAVWNGITYPIFQGFADDFQPDYQGNSWTYVTLTATDATKVFAANDRGESAPAGAGEDSGARITRILDASGWPSADRQVATGDTTLQATTLAGNQLTEMQLVQDTELGELYVDPVGRVVFRNRKAVLTEARSRVAQAVFGDGGYAATGELPYADAKPSTSDEGMANTVTVTREGGTAQTVLDAVSVSRYLTKTFTAQGLLLESDAEAEQYGRAVLYQFASPARRFAQVSFRTPRPEVAPAVWPAVLGREFGDRVTVRRRPPGGGDPIVRDCFVRGVEHTSDGESWTSALVLQSAARYSFFVVGDPVLGVVGSNAIAY
ncbi:hypothetical protein O7602_26665 [Micromonospora sp. WMMD1128]|uniref:hypothetical protein n=1 Tax=Micromonospora sp. WMMD1128 TaxID=3015150 RepID=UPI00248AA7DC|nr:hypothetical protein [Micromonospora sp. WMMD1128]WBB73227.1 hypothetical protein O7602_26665 [Micromonospora sp. WMMD1128]